MESSKDLCKSSRDTVLYSADEESKVQKRSYLSQVCIELGLDPSLLAKPVLHTQGAQELPPLPPAVFTLCAGGGCTLGQEVRVTWKRRVSGNQRFHPTSLVSAPLALLPPSKSDGFSFWVQLNP